MKYEHLASRNITKPLQYNLRFIDKINIKKQCNISKQNLLVNEKLENGGQDKYGK
ncbi:hypothetical protein J2Z42_000721 [Clostridium algifaecis]|uniref:Uncharacterized protein n=1 Tax=Clostridium algifaecis TaxID=1472040 RepID=A0ABS4KPU0_9CLOT|nr:hypothetical protein [Clostridium algifaecis]MBP2032056.1 hypothetical protein [Clostridium algifaecis]